MLKFLSQIMTSRAQAATELAVFGAVLIFILGTIIRSSVGNSYTQNQNLKAMRMAMLASWNDSKAGRLSRTSASVLFIEDRLSPDFTKYGTIDRTPFISNGSGTFSYMMMYPIDPPEAKLNLPIMDVYINGAHFPFTTASFVTGRSISKTMSCAADCPQGAPTQTQMECVANQEARNAREWANGSKLFYVRVANGQDQWSITPPACGPTKDQALCSGLTLTNSDGTNISNSSGDLMFDLNRLNIPSGSQASTIVPSNQRQYMAWQWAATPGIITGDTTDGKDAILGLDPDSNQYPAYDIDGRLKEVTIYGVHGGQGGAISSVDYEDPNGGDIDSGWDSNSCGPKPGLQLDSQIYTFTKDGTWLQIKEGKMFNPESGQFVSSSTARNTIDLIQRKVQLSNNTGRFCSGSEAPYTPLSTVANDGVTPNPVEACSTNCFSTANIAKTCFDPSNNMLYVRSRLEDRRGSNWITDINGQLKVH